MLLAVAGTLAVGTGMHSLEAPTTRCAFFSARRVQIKVADTPTGMQLLSGTNKPLEVASMGQRQPTPLLETQPLTVRRVDLGAPTDRSSANDTYIDGIVGSLLNDPSPYALRGDPGRLRRLCAAVFDPSFDNPKSAAKLDTSMRMWQAYTIEMGTDCWRPDAADLDSFGRKRETVLCAGFLPWALTRMRGRRGNQRALPQSAFKNFLGVVKGHDQRGIAMVSTKLVKYTLKRLCMRHIYDYGAQSMIPKRREPMTRSMILAHRQPGGIAARGVRNQTGADHAGMGHPARTSATRRALLTTRPSSAVWPPAQASPL